MTREDAIRKAINIVAYFEAHFAKSKEAREDAAEIIEILEQEPCKDAIDRQATVERLFKVADFMNEKRKGLGSPYVMAALFIQDNKDEFPSVISQPKIGHWITLIDEYGDVVEAVCSCCDSNGNNKWAFCPHCEAKMEVE